MLAAADLAAASVYGLCLLAVTGSGLDGLPWIALALVLWPLLAKLHGLYDRDHRILRHLTVDELPAIFFWSLVSATATALLLSPATGEAVRVDDALWAWLAGGVSASVLRSAARLVWRKTTSPERAIIVGEGALAQATRRKIALFPDIHVVLSEGGSPSIAELRGNLELLSGLDRVILAHRAIDEELITELVSFCKQARIKLSVVPPARGMFGTAVRLNHIADLPLVEYSTWDVSRSTLLLKRMLDVSLSSLLLIVVSPLLLAAALLVLLDSRGPVLFVQTRAGKEGRPFRIVKLRTMVADAEERLAEVAALDELEEPMFKLEADPRTTRIGRFLRRWSIDELPQLLNVLRGEMSLVGPRPEQVELVERYLPEHRFRLSVKPGLTGPMQVFGRGHLTFEERLAVERDYIENLSLGRDLRLLGMTTTVVVAGRGAF